MKNKLYLFAIFLTALSVGTNNFGSRDLTPPPDINDPNYKEKMQKYLKKDDYHPQLKRKKHKKLDQQITGMEEDVNKLEDKLNKKEEEEKFRSKYNREDIDEQKKALDYFNQERIKKEQQEGFDYFNEQKRRTKQQKKINKQRNEINLLTHYKLLLNAKNYLKYIQRLPNAKKITPEKLKETIENLSGKQTTIKLIDEEKKEIFNDVLSKLSPEKEKQLKKRLEIAKKKNIDTYKKELSKLKIEIEKAIATKILSYEKELKRREKAQLQISKIEKMRKRKIKTFSSPQLKKTIQPKKTKKENETDLLAYYKMLLKVKEDLKSINELISIQKQKKISYQEEKNLKKAEYDLLKKQQKKENYKEKLENNKKRILHQLNQYYSDKLSPYLEEKIKKDLNNAKGFYLEKELNLDQSEQYLSEEKDKLKKAISLFLKKEKEIREKEKNIDLINYYKKSGIISKEKDIYGDEIYLNP